VCDARELKQRMPARGPKTDLRDAHQLALMLAERRAPDPLVIPSLEIRDLRALTRGRIKFTQVMTILINYSRSLAASFGHQASKKSLHSADVKAWFGDLDLPPLARQVHQSGERCRYGPLPHTGNPWLRYVAVLTAQHVGRGPTNRLARYRFRIMMRRGANPAKIATARKVVALAYHLLLHEEDFYEPPREAA
jgi:transposase